MAGLGRTWAKADITPQERHKLVIKQFIGIFLRGRSGVCSDLPSQQCQHGRRSDEGSTCVIQSVERRHPGSMRACHAAFLQHRATGQHEPNV